MKVKKGVVLAWVGLGCTGLTEEKRRERGGYASNFGPETHVKPGSRGGVHRVHTATGVLVGLARPGATVAATVAPAGVGVLQPLVGHRLGDDTRRPQSGFLDGVEDVLDERPDDRVDTTVDVEVVGDRQSNDQAVRADGVVAGHSLEVVETPPDDVHGVILERAVVADGAGGALGHRRRERERAEATLVHVSCGDDFGCAFV